VPTFSNIYTYLMGHTGGKAFCNEVCHNIIVATAGSAITIWGACSGILEQKNVRELAILHLIWTQY